MNIGKNIRKIRETENLSQQELAEIVHVTRQTVSNWENEKSYPDLETLVTISDRFNVSLDSMLKTDMELVRKIDRQKQLARRRKRMILIILAVVILLTGAAAYGYAPGNPLRCDVKPVHSKLHTQAEYRTAVRVTKRYFIGFRGCTLQRIWYAGDDRVRAEAESIGKKPKDVIVLMSDFQVGSRGVDPTFEMDEAVTNWSWTIVRGRDGRWRHHDHGYA